MWPESSLAISIVGTFAVRSELQSFYYEYGIDDRFCSQTACFSNVLIVSSQPDKVESGSPSKSGVGRTKAGDHIARIDPAFVDSKVLLCLGIVMKGDSSRAGKR